jgi:antitoxin component YwqK of YwqJK toxin-antitoxin module
MKFLYLILFFTTSIYSQEINQLDSEGKKDGNWKGTYSDSKRPRYEGIFNHGKEVGLFKFFDDTKAGTLIATREFNTKDNSCYTVFYNQRKNKVSEGKQIGKDYDGEWKYYHENSTTIMTLENYKNGKLNSVRKVFYPNDVLAEEANYTNGAKDGNYKSYAENSVLLENTNYKNGQYDGQAVFKNASNIVVGKGKFKNGKKVGIWTYNNGGKITTENMDKKKANFQKRTTPIKMN